MLKKAHKAFSKKSKGFNIGDELKGPALRDGGAMSDATEHEEDVPMLLTDETADEVRDFSWLLTIIYGTTSI